MLAQQLRQLEDDGIVERTVHQQVPPRVDYKLTQWGQELCPVLDALLRWAECRQERTHTSSRLHATARES